MIRNAGRRVVKLRVREIMVPPEKQMWCARTTASERTGEFSSPGVYLHTAGPELQVKHAPMHGSPVNRFLILVFLYDLW